MKCIVKYLGLLAAIGFSLMFAGQSMALTIRPAIIETSLKQGESGSYSIRIVNDSNEAVELGITAVEAEGAASEDGVAKYNDRNESSTLANWIGAAGMVKINANDSANVVFPINVPSNAPVGGHYAGLQFTELRGAPTAGAGVLGGLVANIALDVPGQTIEKGDVLTFATADGKTSYDKLPVSFTTRINNGGNRHFKPQGAITVKNMFGSVVATLPFNVTNGGGNVLPRSTREFTNDWQGEFAFGKYTAMLNVDLAGAGVKTASLDLWVMPAGLLVLWLIIALIILVILVLLIRRALLSSPAMKK